MIISNKIFSNSLNRRVIIVWLMAVAVLSSLSSCFTGVESTPKITYKESKYRDDDATAEKQLASTFVAEPFATWKPGKKFIITNDKIAYAVSTTSQATDTPALQRGTILTYTGSLEMTTVAGTNEAILRLTTGSDTIYYRTGTSTADLKKRKSTEIPFTIDLTLVETVRQQLIGQHYFIRTPLWYDKSGNTSRGRKFIPVEITDVEPGDDNYPVAIGFRTTDHATTHISDTDITTSGWVYMSAYTPGKNSTRSFDSLFSFTDPREKHTNISKEIWTAIQNSRATEGMTREEAALALGSPRNIDRGHDHSSTYERWTYPDGIYLIFEDGILTRFHQ